MSPLMKKRFILIVVSCIVMFAMYLAAKHIYTANSDLTELISFIDTIPASEVAAAIIHNPRINYINNKKPDIIIIGNSMIGNGLDITGLSKATNQEVMKIQSSGGMSAWQFLVLKNVIGNANHRPKIVVVVTREHLITIPNMRVSGKYRKVIESLKGLDEKVLFELAYQNRNLNYKGPVDISLGSWDFKKIINKSFLPYMIRIARERKFQLVITRHKTRRYAENSTNETAEQKKYTEDICEYLKNNKVIFLDYIRNSDIMLEHYGGGDHLNKRGKEIWTRSLAKDLNKILNMDGST